MPAAVPRRILHLVHTPRHSGAEMLVRELCLAHQAAGHACAVAAFAPGDGSFAAELAELAAAGVALHLPARPLRHLDRLRFFRAATRRFGADVVLGHAVLPSLYGRAALLGMARRPKFLSILHSATNDDFAAPELRAAERLLSSRADLTIGVSAEGVAAYRRRVGGTRPTALIPNGIDVARFVRAAAARDTHRDRLGLAAGDILVVQAGRLSPVKQQQLSLDTLAPMLTATPALQLWFAGIDEDAGYSAALRAAAAPWQGRVRVLGGRSDIAELLASADLFLMPSLMESQGIALLEALASGVAVVASRIPSFHHAEALPGVTLVDSRDGDAYCAAIVESLSFAPRRFIRNVDHFDIATTAASYLHWIETVCQGVRSHGSETIVGG